MSVESLDVDVRPVAGRIGAEITGIRLDADLEPGVVQRIRQAVLEHKVVFFREQHHLDNESQVRFAEQLGTLTTAHPTVPGDGDAANVLPLDSTKGGRANSWHTDVTFVDRPPAFSILRGVTIPPYGGDTQWANTVSAYEGLAEPLRRLADQLWALHTNVQDYAGRTPQATEAELERHRVFVSETYETAHPVVRVHPETGERSLLLGHFVQRFVGFNDRDSSHLFRLFQDHVTRPENTVRWRWAPGDVAIWDNRATQHYAVSDYGDNPRKVHRVTVAGDVPVSVNGERSTAHKGDSSAYVGAEPVPQ
jgi:alpha-ketoglutarate-dependent taurine dioxygenase